MARLYANEHPEKTVEECETEIKKYLSDEHSLVVPRNYKQSDKTTKNGWMFDRDAKELIHPVLDHFNLDKYKVAEEMKDSEIFDDVRKLIEEIVEMCK